MKTPLSPDEASFPFPSRAALVLAHPGHELRIHGLVERTRPLTFVLTDGSGRSGVSRLGFSESLLCERGAVRGGVFGRFTDAALYRAVLERRTALFVGLAHEIADALAREGTDVVIADAAEGYSPAHDLCRFVADAAARLASERSGKKIRSFAFALVGAPRGEAALVLDDAELERKVEAARRYAPLAAEVEETLRQLGRDAMRVERFRETSGDEAQGDTPPYYETYGERQVAAGFYDHVLREREHVLPIREALLAAIAVSAV